MIELKRQEEYIKMVKRKYLTFWQSLLMKGSTTKKHYVDMFNCPATLKHYLVCDGDICYVKSELDEMAQETIEVWRNFEKFEKIRRKILKAEKDVLKSVSSDLADFVEPFERYMPLLISILVIENLIEEDLRTALSEKIGESEAEEYLDKLNIPFEDNFYKKEEYDLVKTKDISAHVKEYEWIKSRYGKIDPYTEKEAREKLKNINREEFLLEWEESKKELQKTIKEVKGILGKEKRHLVDVMQFIVFYRTQRTDIINKAIYLFAPTLEKMARKLGLTYDQILHCTKDELIEKKIPSIDEIQERMNGFSMIADSGKVECYSGEEHQEIVDFFKKDLSNISEVKGISACKGNAQGKARIVLGVSDFEKVGKGDVLITSMTTPNFVPIMKEASAFVTDEGGITCHAAIISREMKKPCIIGTKIATQVLKDGDLVEVDANKGIVKILEKVKDK